MARCYQTRVFKILIHQALLDSHNSKAWSSVPGLSSQNV